MVFRREYDFALAWFNVFLANSKINFSKDSMIIKPTGDKKNLKSLSDETDSDAGPKTKKFPLHFDNKNKVTFYNTTYKIQMKNSEEIELIGEEFTLLLIKNSFSADSKKSSNSQKSSIDQKIKAMQGKWCLDIEKNEDIPLLMLLFHLDDEKDVNQVYPLYEVNGKELLLKVDGKVEDKWRLKEKANKLFFNYDNEKIEIMNIISESNRKMKMIIESEGERDTIHYIKCSELENYYKED